MKYFILLMAISNFVISIYFGADRYLFLKSAKVTEGKISSYIEHGEDSFTPLFEFEVDGQILQVKNPYTSPHRLAAGDSVVVTYNPKNPKEAEISPLGFQYVASCLFLGMSLISFVLYRFFYLRKRS